MSANQPPGSYSATAVQVCRAALGLLRVSQRLLQSGQPDAVPAVMRSLQLLGFSHASTILCRDVTSCQH